MFRVHQNLLNLVIFCVVGGQVNDKVPIYHDDLLLEPICPLDSSQVVCISFTQGDQDEPTSVILATAGNDHTFKFWEAKSGRCCRTLQYPDSVSHFDFILFVFAFIRLF